MNRQRQATHKQRKQNELRKQRATEGEPYRVRIAREKAKREAIYNRQLDVYKSAAPRMTLDSILHQSNYVYDIHNKKWIK